MSRKHASFRLAGPAKRPDTRRVKTKGAVLRWRSSRQHGDGEVAYAFSIALTGDPRWMLLHIDDSELEKLIGVLQDARDSWRRERP